MNNAGIMICKEFLELSETDIRRTMDVNIMAHFWVSASRVHPGCGAGQCGGEADWGEVESAGAGVVLGCGTGKGRAGGAGYRCVCVCGGGGRGGGGWTRSVVQAAVRLVGTKELWQGGGDQGEGWVGAGYDELGVRQGAHGVGYSRSAGAGYTGMGWVMWGQVGGVGQVGVGMWIGAWGQVGGVGNVG